MSGYLTAKEGTSDTFLGILGSVKDLTTCRYDSLEGAIGVKIVY